MHIIDLLENHAPLEKIATLALAKPTGEALRLSRVPVSSWGPFVAWLARKSERTVVLICATNESAENVFHDVVALRDESDPEPLFFSAPDRALLDDDDDRNATQERLGVLDALHRGPRCLVVTTISALAHPTLPPRELLYGYDELKVGGVLNRDDFIEHLAETGYDRVPEVEAPGQFAVRGGILDFYPPAAGTPIRLELFGEEIDSLRSFDLESQRSTEKLKSVQLTPPRELYVNPKRGREIAAMVQKTLDERVEILKAFPDEVAEIKERFGREIEHLSTGAYFKGIERYRGLLYPEHPTLFDHLPDGAIVVLASPERAEAQVTRLNEEAQAFAEDGLLSLPNSLCTFDELVELSNLFSRVELRTGDDSNQDIDLDIHLPVPFSGKLDALVGFIKEQQDAGRIIVCATSHARRVREILADHGIRQVHLIDELVRAEAGNVIVLPRRLTAGFLWGQTTVLCDAEMFGWQTFQPQSSARTRIKKEKRSNRFSSDSSPLSRLGDLKVGDYVVHINHGIARYGGVVQRELGGAVNEYLALEYDGEDRLFVPVGQLDRVQHYLGSEASVPALTPLRGGAWEKAKTRAREEAMKAARELADLYAARDQAQKVPVGPDTMWQREMESAFPYEETPTQLQAIKDAKADLEGSRPMDRLVCGDVGFGKTEVAVRAAFKCVQDGRQVAILVPTTVLAQQHYQTFAERMAAYPVRVEVVSRFRTASEVRRVVQELKLGAVDIVVGTHRLLQPDIEFANLGLVVVDEEQRFGVMHKERLKEVRKAVDILTMSATPIPRTLQMAVGGLREISLITDPPQGRLPVRTYVSPFKEAVLKASIERELEREGQVYYVHNRVDSIAHVAAALQKLVPQARIGVGHGQMPDEELEQVMLDFMHHRTDVLLATTIIENGLDLPNANTLICDHADKLGLSQMYQLRGRVGRSSRQAYAYFFTSSRGKLSADADDRLAALQENTDLGAGFRIAMRDLEIRGSGDVLGLKQSGSLAAVGLEMYSEMLAEAVARLRGESKHRYTKAQELPEVDLPVHAFLPTDYILEETERLAFYRKMTLARQSDDAKAIQEELRDRFGPLPPPAFNLLRILKIRINLLHGQLRGITRGESEVLIRLKPGDVFTDADIAAAYAAVMASDARSRQHISLRKLEGMVVDTRVLEGSSLLRLIETVVEALSRERGQRFVAMSAPVFKN